VSSTTVRVAAASARPVRSAIDRRALALALVGLWIAGPAPAQIGLPDLGSESAAASPEPTLEERIESVRADIATRVAALGEGAALDQQIVGLRRLLDVLQRTGEAGRISAQLRAGHDEASQRAARPPSAYFKVDPPFAVPLLDAVFLSWEAQQTQLERLAAVAADTRAALEAAREDFEQAERRRRRARDERDEAAAAAERARLAELLGRRELESRIARADRELARVALENAELEVAMQRAAERQAAAALEWVRGHLLPDDGDLEEVIADLDKRGFDLERALESTRLDLADAAGRLDAARARTSAAAPDEAAVRAAEVAARRLAYTAAQRRAALLGERAERLGLAKQAWQRRYRVLAGPLDAADSGLWRIESEGHVDDLRRQRRIKQARRDELSVDLDELRGRILAFVTSDAAAGRQSGLSRWLRAQENDYLALTRLYDSDLASLDETLRLQERLLAELRAHDEGLALRERLARLRETATEVWAYEVMASQDRPITIGKITTALFVFVAGLMLARRIARGLSGRVLSRFGWDPGVRSAFESLFFYSAVALVFLIALRTVNIPLTAFAVVGGALALGIGFGSQAVVSNFISGLILLAERPIKAGDHVEVEGIYGMVERIGLRSTRIRTGDNFHIIVPNASFLERSVINWTHDTNKVRLKVAVGVAYGSPTRLVERSLVEVAAAHDATLPTPAPIAIFMDFADSCLLFEVRFWIRVHDIGDKLLIESQVRFAIDDRFREEGIEIAFPQRDLHIDAARPVPVRIERDPAGEGSRTPPA